MRNQSYCYRFINYSKDTKKVQRKLNFYTYKWLFRVKPYIIALFFMDKLRDVNKERFLGKVKEKFGDYFCLDEVEYVNNKTKVTIICPIHGRFDIRPNGASMEKN